MTAGNITFLLVPKTFKLQVNAHCYGLVAKKGITKLSDLRRTTLVSPFINSMRAISVMLNYSVWKNYLLKINSRIQTTIQ